MELKDGGTYRTRAGVEHKVIQRNPGYNGFDPEYVFFSTKEMSTCWTKDGQFNPKYPKESYRDLVEEVNMCVTNKSELEQLVETANAGFSAVRKIKTEFPHKTEFMRADENSWVVLGDVEHSKSSKIRIKKKEAPTLTLKEGHLCYFYDGDRVNIGCKNFNTNVLKSYLIDIYNRDAYLAGSISVSLKGLHYQDHGVNTISHESGRAILAWLEENA